MKFIVAALLLSAVAVHGLSGVENAEPLPVGFGGVPGLVWKGLHKVDASGDFVGTKQTEGAKVLANAEGGAASLSSPRPFHVNGFYYSNPNAETPLTITITAQPSGQVTVLNLLPDQGPTFVGPFHAVTSLEFVPSVPGSRKLLAADTTFALDAVSLALADGAPPPGAASRPPAPLLPTEPPGTPTLVPSVTPSVTPAVSPSGTPSVVPSVTPTLVPGVTPTAAPRPATCPDGGQYRASGGCRKCVTRSSPFRQFVGAGTLCYPPTTLSERSIVCTAAVLPAFIVSNIGSEPATCIDPTNDEYLIDLPIRNGNIRYLTGNSYVDTSIRLDGTLLPSGGKSFVKTKDGITRVQYGFIDAKKKLLSKPHSTVQLTGVVTRPGSLLDFCFVAYLKVC